jgi:HD-like signal output (HDOD) protein/CheY-like chemotaxis protein
MKTLLFVDDEPMLLQGLQRQLRPMRGEWDMNFVDGGRKALDFMAARPVDAVVTDMMMPGMDGEELLVEIVKRHPQTVRIILSGHSERETALRLVGPAHQYLSKPCDAGELRLAIARALALRELMGNDRLKLLVTRIKTLPALPALQNQLTAELQKESPSIERVGEIISRDIGMTAKILQIVNSAFFGLGQPVSNVTEAAIYLGLNTIHSLALLTGIFSQFDQKICKTFSLDALAQNSWTTAVMARCVARAERQDAKIMDQCFLAGLLHNVGQLVLAFSLPDEYADVIARARREQLPVWQAEQESFGATHSDVGAYLLALWGLPNPIIEAVALQHQPARCAAPEFSPAIAVHAAEVFAHELAGSKIEAAPPVLDLAYLTSAGFGERIEPWRESCRETVEA